MSDQSIRRWVKAGELKAYKPKKEYRIAESDLQEFLEGRAVPLVQTPLPEQKPEERRAEWDAAVRSARLLRERGRARMEELLSSWRDKRDRRALRGMGQLLQEAYDAETALLRNLEEESTARVRLERVPSTEGEEVRKASRFYGALREMVQGAGLDVRTEGKAHEVKGAA